MPDPIEVELVPHAEGWNEIARLERLRLREALTANVVVIHHIGSTAIAGIHAKPIIDLLPIVRSVKQLDEQRPILQQLGYEYWGEYGISGRRYCTSNDPATGRRKFQLHCFDPGNEAIERHLAFRDYLRANAVKAMEYDAEKRRCRELHPNDSHAYTEAKADWIVGQLPAALARFRHQSE